MKKKKLLLLVLATCLLTGCGKTIPTLENGQEAMVTFKDGTKISVNEVWEEMKDSYALSVVMNKVDAKILKDKYQDKTEAMEQYVKVQKTLIEANFKDREEELTNQLNQAGYTDLEDYLERSVRMNYLTDLAVTDYAKSVVTDKEIKAYYNNNVLGEISAVHILVKPESKSEEDLNKAKERANTIISDIKKDIKSGTSALDAFNKYKDDKTVTFEDLGFFEKEDMVEAFSDAAYALKKNGYTTSPVKTEYGYHIILKTDEKEKASLEDKKESIKETLASEKISKDTTISVTAMVELRKEYGVEIIDSEINKQYNNNINYQLNNK